jgi:hypothetical protein
MRCGFWNIDCLPEDEDAETRNGSEMSNSGER